MRASIIAFGVLAATAAWSASAQSTGEQARDDYQAELGRQCPDKQLQLLSTRNLSDALDDYKQSLGEDIRARFDQAESANCSSLDAGADCVNTVDLATADDTGRMPDLVGTVCSSFLRCREQNDCDYAR